MPGRKGLEEATDTALICSPARGSDRLGNTERGQHTTRRFALARKSEVVVDRKMIRAVLTVLGKRGGLKGGPARARALSPERRREIGRIAATARWKKKRKRARSAAA